MSVYPDGPVVRSAQLSECERYRYRLMRRWGPGNVLPFVMLNPSTADAEDDDPTVRRCVGFARSLGYDALGVWNLYALRATDPADLWVTDDPVGPDNDRRLRNLLAWAYDTSTPVVAAWGAGARSDRVRTVLSMDGSSCMQALGLTSLGAPRHPLYLPSTATLSPYALPEPRRERRARR